MHRTEGENFDLVGGLNFFKDGPPGTKVEKNFLNAIQEELVGLIEGSGLTINTASTDSRDQLQKAVSKLASLLTYAIDAGIADAYVITLSPALTAYTTGTIVRFKTTNINTGASTINVNSLGVVNIKSNNGNDPEAGEIPINKIVTLEHDGTNFVIVNPLVLTDCKGWINFNGGGVIAIRDSYNVSSIVDNGVGDYTVNWDVNFADVNYSIAGMASLKNINSVESMTVGAVRIQAVFDPVLGLLEDTDIMTLIARGIQ